MPPLTLPETPEAIMRLRQPGIDRIYPILSAEVHELVGVLLNLRGTEHCVTHLNKITPHLAVRALATHSGLTLPQFAFVRGTDGAPVYSISGQTREITIEDRFTISEGPTPIGRQPQGGYMTWLLRAG